MRERKAQPATRNFSRNSFGVRVCVCVPYIYKIKIKKIIYYIELRFAASGKHYLKIENATGLRVALLLHLPMTALGRTDTFDDAVGFQVGEMLFYRLG